MPLGASRIAFLAKTSVSVVAEVIRKKHNLIAVNNTQISTSQSKFGGSSGFWDGTGDYLILPAGEGADFSGDFTIECWYYPTSVGSNDKLFDLRGINAVHEGGGTGTISLGDTLLLDQNSSDFRCFIDGGDRSTAGAGTFTVNTWHHVAIQRQSGTINAWVNGTRYVDYAGTDNYTGVFTVNQPIGANLETTSNTSNLQGYMDELRISTVARYTNGATITTPTAPFTNDDDTYVLCHFDGTNTSSFFDDDNGVRQQASGVGFGNVQIDTARYKFGGASALFDGTGDYIVADVDLVNSVGSGATTWECFFNVDVDAGSGTVAVLSNRFGGTSNGEVQMLFRNLDMKVQVNGYGTGAFSANGVGSALAVDTWHHYVWARNGSGDWAVWVNGTRVANGTGYTQSLTNDGGFGIGAHADGGIPLNSGTSAWIDEVRITNSDVYGVGNTSITVPTAPFTNDANTLLLLHMEGTDGDTVFRDDNGKGRSAVGIIANGNAQVDTALSKFGNSSALFDGVDDALQIADGSTFRLADGNPFTVECWVNKSASGGDAYQHIFSNNWNAASTSVRGWTFLIDNTNKPAFFWSAGTGPDQNITSSSAISTGTWTHIAVTSDGSGNIKLYIDGTQTASTASADLNESMSSEYPRIGATSTNVTLGNYSGSIDEMRVSDTVRYTTAFTPSTTPFQNDANTLLLLHMDGKDASTTFIDDNGNYTV